MSATSRRGLFGLIGGGAAAMAIPTNQVPARAPIGGWATAPAIPQPMSTAEYLRSLIERKNNIGKRELPPQNQHYDDIQCLKSVSAGHKTRMSREAEQRYYDKREAWDIQREIDILLDQHPMLKAMLT